MDRLRLLLCVGWLAVATLASALGEPALAAPRAGTAQAAVSGVDAARDPRLSRRVYLRSEGVPVSHVLQRLSQQTGVPLRADGRAGNELLIAFVPDAPLAEVMHSIADLYRLQWIRGTGERPGYRLVKRPAAVQEEAKLREHSIREALPRLTRSMDVALQKPAIHPVEQRIQPLRHFMLRHTRQHLAQLVEQGHLTIPAAHLPPHDRAQLLSQLQNLLNWKHEEQLRSWKELQEEIRNRGDDPSTVMLPPPPPASPPAAEDCTFTVDFNAGSGMFLNAELRLSPTVRPPDRFMLFYIRDTELRDAGLSLYRDRSLRPNEVAGADEASAPANDPFYQKFTSAPRPADPSDFPGWMTTLEQLSETAGISIYSDHYGSVSDDRHATVDMLAPGNWAANVLRQLCEGHLGRGEPRNFWWRRGNAALIRNRRWLWHETMVLPADFRTRLAALTQGTPPRPDARVLPLLGSLSPQQTLGLIRGHRAKDAWRYAVLAPSRLSFRAQHALFEPGGLTWEKLSLEEQRLLLRMLPMAAEGGTPRFTAAITTNVGHDGIFIQDDTSVRLIIQATCGPHHATAEIVIPIPKRRRYELLVLEPQRIRQPWPPVPRLVFALYYPWYGLRTVSGSNQRVTLPAPGKPPSNFAHQPASGPYDSTDPTTLRRHLRELKTAGVDVLACSWWGPESLTDRAIRKLLPLAEEEGLRVCLVLEPYRRLVEKPSADTVAREIESVLSALGQHPAYLWVNEQPVVLITQNFEPVVPGLATRIDLQTWAEVLRLLDKSSPTGVRMIVNSDHPVECRVFGGLWLNPFSTEPQREIAPLLRQLRARQKLTIASVLPGFDARHIAQDPDAVLDREDGALYRAAWEGVLVSQPDWVLINSFNEWELGTEIEPSVEYGDLYLKLTAEYARRFKQSAAPPPPMK